MSLLTINSVGTMPRDHQTSLIYQQGNAQRTTILADMISLGHQILGTGEAEHMDDGEEDLEDSEHYYDRLRKKKLLWRLGIISSIGLAVLIIIALLRGDSGQGDTKNLKREQNDSLRKALVNKEAPLNVVRENISKLRENVNKTHNVNMTQSTFAGMLKTVAKKQPEIVPAINIVANAQQEEGTQPEVVIAQHKLEKELGKRVEHIKEERRKSILQGKIPSRRSSQILGLNDTPQTRVESTSKAGDDTPQKMDSGGNDQGAKVGSALTTESHVEQVTQNKAIEQRDSELIKTLMAKLQKQRDGVDAPQEVELSGENASQEGAEDDDEFGPAPPTPSKPRPISIQPPPPTPQTPQQQMLSPGSGGQKVPTQKGTPGKTAVRLPLGGGGEGNRGDLMAQIRKSESRTNLKSIDGLTSPTRSGGVQSNEKTSPFIPLQSKEPANMLANISLQPHLVRSASRRNGLSQVVETVIENDIGGAGIEEEGDEWYDPD